MDTNINIDEEMSKIDPEWKLSADRKKISREFHLPDFLPALDFVRAVGEDAEKRDHHPDIHIYVKRVVLELTTFDAGEVLTDMDFQSAKAIDEIYDQEYGK
jgi:4a-hydroxytetrahydrobiopterin dehydratase